LKAKQGNLTQVIKSKIKVTWDEKNHKSQAVKLITQNPEPSDQKPHTRKHKVTWYKKLPLQHKSNVETFSYSHFIIYL
jgi:hypothetical protein